MKNMAKWLLVLAVLVGAHGALGAQGLPDLVIDTTMEFDMLRGGVKIEPAPPKGQLFQYRSYLMAVAVQNLGAPTSQPFTVRTECVRPQGRRVSLGEARVVIVQGSAFALYSIFPSSAGTGRCMLETTVDANLEVRESSEEFSMLSGKRVAQVHTMHVEIMPNP